MLRIVVILVVVLGVTSVNSAEAFDGQRKGFVIGLGLGFSPYAGVRVPADSRGPEVTDHSAGLAFGVTLGWGFSESDWIAIRLGQVGRESTEFDKRLEHRFRGVAWYHAFGPRGSAWVTSLGGGYYHMNNAGNSISICIRADGTPCPRPSPTLDGYGVLAGLGRQFAPRWTLMAYGVYGKAERLDRDYDLGHASIELEYLWD